MKQEGKQERQERQVALGTLERLRDRIGPVTTDWSRDRALRIHGYMIEEVEISMNALKDESYGD